MARFNNLSQNFTMIPNWLINNQNISLKAKGLFIYLASKPNDFDFSAQRIAHANKEGLTSVKNCLNELELVGLLIRTKIKNEDGKFIGIEYTLNDKPLDIFTVDGKPNDGKTDDGKPNDINKKDTNKKDLNKKDLIKSINIPFDDFWDLYDKKVGHIEKLKNKWNKLKDSERELIIKFIPEYKKSQPDKKYRKNPDTFFNQKTWNDELIFDTPKTQTKQFEKEDNQRGLVSVI